MTISLYQVITNPALPTAIGSGSGEPIIGRIVAAIIGLFLVGGFILAMLHIVMGAIAWISAGGDKNRLQQAQERITSAIIGLIILTAIWAIMLLIGTFLGFGFPKFSVPTFLNPNAPSDTVPAAPGTKFRASPM